MNYFQQVVCWMNNVTVMLDKIHSNIINSAPPTDIYITDAQGMHYSFPTGSDPEKVKEFVASMQPKELQGPMTPEEVRLMIVSRGADKAPKNKTCLTCEWNYETDIDRCGIDNESTSGTDKSACKFYVDKYACEEGTCGGCGWFNPTGQCNWDGEDVSKDTECCTHFNEGYEE